jgi:hypothetical protein
MGWRYISKRHRAICDVVAAAVREGIKGVNILDDELVKNIYEEITDEEGALKRPDLMYESFVKKKNETKRIFNLTEITSPGVWEASLDVAYDAKVRKYDPVKLRLMETKDCDEVRLNVIVVSP